MTDSSRLARLWPALAIAIILGFIYLPIVVIAVNSVSTTRSGVLPIEGLTGEWYRELFTDERFTSSLRFSLEVAALSTLVAVVLGTAAALGVSRGRSAAYRPVVALVCVPLLLPALVVAICMAVGFKLADQELSRWTVVCGHVVVDAPVVFVVVLARLRGFDWSLVDAARTLGASSTRAFWLVTAPLIAPAVVGGAVLAFALSLDNFVVSLFLTGSDSTVPLLIWSMMRGEFTPVVNAIATMLLVGTLGAALVAERLMRLRTHR